MIWPKVADWATDGINFSFETKGLVKKPYRHTSPTFVYKYAAHVLDSKQIVRKCKITTKCHSRQKKLQESIQKVKAKQLSITREHMDVWHYCFRHILCAWTGLLLLFVAGKYPDNSVHQRGHAQGRTSSKEHVNKLLRYAESSQGFTDIHIKKLWSFAPNSHLFTGCLHLHYRKICMAINYFPV